ncbi:MAG: hypothetical protein K2P87_00535 [Lachnospiraceae bacterium]|nr:hypothetical protein [Lachnospiraceae bacterium]
MKSKIIILSAKPWDMVDEVTKQPRSGVSLHYMMTETLKPQANSGNGELGYTVTRERISVDAAKALEDVPGVYDGDFILKVRSGKNVPSVSTVEFVAALE